MRLNMDTSALAADEKGDITLNDRLQAARRSGLLQTLLKLGQIGDDLLKGATKPLHWPKPRRILPLRAQAVADV